MPKLVQSDQPLFNRKRVNKLFGIVIAAGFFVSCFLLTAIGVPRKPFACGPIECEMLD